MTERSTPNPSIFSTEAIDPETRNFISKVEKLLKTLLQIM